MSRTFFRQRRSLALAAAVCLLTGAFPGAAVRGIEPVRPELGSSCGPVEELEAGWAAPPRLARTRCYWWWLNGNVTREAITRDLEAMHAKGFGGAMIFDADGSAQRGNRSVPAGPMFGSEAWRALFVHAVKEADRLGLELSLSIQSGWNLGGPDVTPEETAKQLTWSEVPASGPGRLEAPLPVPEHRGDYYRDVAVLALPIEEDDEEPVPAAVASASSNQRDHPAGLALDGSERTFWVSRGRDPGDGPTPERPAWIDLSFHEPISATGLMLKGRDGYGPKRCRLLAAGEGEEPRVVATFDVADRRPRRERFEPVSAARFRLECLDAFDRTSPDAPRNVQIAEFRLRDERGRLVGGRSAASGIPLDDLHLKSMFRELGGSAPDCRPLLFDASEPADRCDLRLPDVVNLTDRLGPDGTLDWDVPEGRWTVLRFGYTPTAAKVSTSSGDWQGPVVDYLSRPVLEAYWGRHVEPLLRLVEPYCGRTLNFLHTDSWECGGMNWSAGFEKEFRRRRGYDPIPWLAVIAGKVVDSPWRSNAFLADLRKTLSDCVAENHYGRFAELAHQRGLGIHPESGGPHAGPLDGVKFLGRNDVPMSEFWRPSPHRPLPPNRFFVKQASAAAHVYGRRIVAAEGFTSIGPHWNDSFHAHLKPSFDHEICSGLNLTYIHTFTCSPRAMGMPGQEYFAGTHFNPNCTWWDMSAAFIAYLNRCHYLMQSGRFVADVLYYYGDHVPNIAARKQSDPAGVLPGFDYDVICEELLVDGLEVDDAGRLALPSGASYRVLVLPDHRVLSLAALTAIARLVREGATVVGLKPEEAVSLVGGEEAAAEFSTVADELWGETEEAGAVRSVGKGRVVAAEAARPLLVADAVAPDFECACEEDVVVDYAHRTVEVLADDGRTVPVEVYFVANRSPEPVHAECRFRVVRRRPEIWDPVTGAVRAATDFRQSGEQTTVPLSLAAYGSTFVVFREPIGEDEAGSGRPNFPAPAPRATLSGPWTVRFDPEWGGPETIRFERLIDWTAHPLPGVKYYSGTAIYEKTFELPQGGADFEVDRPFYLDLGTVREMARVRLNGRDLGVVWTAPFRVEIGGAIRRGSNELEIEIANHWTNRLVGDEHLPPEERRTRTNVAPFHKDTPLVPSGLLGPVTIRR